MVRRKDNSRKAKAKRISPYTIVGFLFLMIVICATLTIKGHSLKVQSRNYDAKITQLEAQKAELEKQSQEITEFKNYVKTDEYTEEVAREKLGLVHEGEIVFQPEN